MSHALLPPLEAGGDRLALSVAGDAMTYAELAAAAAGVADRLAGARRVAVVATSTLDTALAVLGAIAAGAAVVPIAPGAGVRELEHMVGDAAPEALLAGAGVELPAALDGLPRVPVRGAAGSWREPAGAGPDDTAMILYTSGTTGLPKGVQIPRRAIATNLDAIYDAWAWTAADRLVHALPLYHVHGLILGVIGSLRRGAATEHLGRFSPGAVADAFEGGATMLFGVPTMYHRLALAAEEEPRIAAALARARLLVSGSAALPAVEHVRIESICGQQVVERYGMTETMMICAVRADGERRAGYVGRPVPGVEIRLVDDEGAVLPGDDDATIGEIEVRGPNLFTGYLNRPDATEEAFRDGWFRTGDMATRAADGYVRIVGRRSTDLIKSAGYRIGAGEIEGALLEHPDVLEAAVRGEPDADLGERIVAWVVLRPDADRDAAADVLIAHTGVLLAGYKRPREVHVVAELPRNAMGKVVKARLARP
jgi:malonyl-CoA/methylmalonyl-CoA synthetase